MVKKQPIKLQGFKCGKITNWYGKKSMDYPMTIVEGKDFKSQNFLYEETFEI